MLQKFNPKNAATRVYVDGKIVPREEAKISVFDSVVQGGDAVWEHIPDRMTIRKALAATLEANGLEDETHILARYRPISGMDAAIMLDHVGFVSELNDANLFMIRGGTVYTPLPDACLHGITRGIVMQVCRDIDVPLREQNLSLAEFYDADAVFATGTMGEITPVTEIDGRQIINRSSHHPLENIIDRFHTLIPQYTEKIN